VTIDERINKLTESHEEMDVMQRKTQVMLAPIVERVGRLERIALSHEVRIQDVEATLAALEGRTRKPQ
jgi:hypothetical protein